MRTYKIGTRGSDLALWQAHFLQEQLRLIDIVTELEIISTKGDRIQDIGFDKLEGKGFFTKEIEDALLDESVDIAVHSMKDMPTTQPHGLVLGAVSYREDARDMLLIRPDIVDPTQPLSLSQGAIVGTSSARRKAQVLSLAPQVNLQDIRGNVPTRINKLRSGSFDAILLAKAGIDRLQLDISDLQSFALHPSEFVPAPAQGVLAFQCREEDLTVRRILTQIHHPEVSACTNIERSLLKMLEGGCHIPLGVHVSRDTNGYYHGLAAYASAWNDKVKRVQCSQSTHVGMAENLFQQLKK